MTQRENRMGTAPVWKLMGVMGVPMILSMVFQAVYNLVDSWFISHMSGDLGELGVHALTLAYPVQILMIGIGVGTGVGINALLSRYLGKGDGEGASRLSGNGIFLGILTYAVFLLLGIFGTEPYLATQTQDARVLAMGSQYLYICMIFSFGAILFMIYEKLLQGSGKTGYATFCQIGGALVNMILDPIFIFGLLGVPAMGITGAAIATVLGQIFSLVVSMGLHHCCNREVRSGFRYLRPDPAMIREIYAIGIPAMFMQFLMSVMNYGVNRILGPLGSHVVTAYGVYYKIQQFVVFAASGLNNALIPIIGFNYGAGNVRRVREGIRYGLLYVSVMMLAGTAIFWLGADAIVSCFALSGETLALSICAMHCVPLGYLFLGINTACQGIFQAFGKGMLSLILSFIRLFAVVLPLLYLFSTLPGALSLVWWAFPAAEACGFVVAVICLRGPIRKKINACDQ